MNGERSFYGPCLVDKPRRARRVHSRRAPGVLSAVAVMVVSAVVIASAMAVITADDSLDLRAGISSQTILNVGLIEQQKDTTMQCWGGAFCQPTPGQWPPHPFPPYVAPTDVDGLDGIYGNADDCPHCSAYCAPAGIAMIAAFRSMPFPKTSQDDIYDQGKIVNEAGVGDGNLSTHAVGMYDGIGGWPTEVQSAFVWSVGPFIQHDWSMGVPLTPAQLKSYIDLGHPVLWLDHNGWPKNMSYPSSDNRQDMGHAKVIIGYDNNNTADFADDRVLVNDPWPEYNANSTLPLKATAGPGGTYSPYWLALNDVNLNDPADIYLVDTFADIPEFGAVLVPVVGVLVAAVFAGVHRRGRRTPTP